MRKSIKYSQNFIKDKNLVKKLIEISSINQDDIVYEIGAGLGTITSELVNHCKKVVAFEIDTNLSKRLKEKFAQQKEKVEIINTDFLSFNLPDGKYKIFSNIPFNITSDIIKKLVFADNPPVDIYLIVQKEAALKFSGKKLEGKKNSLMAVLVQATFSPSVIHSFNRGNFTPQPSVEAVFFRLKKRPNPLVRQDLGLFYNFVTFAFNQHQPNISEGLKKILDKSQVISILQSDNLPPSITPGELDIPGWVNLFTAFKSSGKKNNVVGSYQKLLSQQKTLKKVRRTRIAKNWKRYIPK